MIYKPGAPPFWGQIKKQKPKVIYVTDDHSHLEKNLGDGHIWVSYNERFHNPK